MAITTDIDFPDGLPYPTREGYSLKTVQPFLRTEMASGRAKQRRSFTSVPTMVSVSWVFDNDLDAANFEVWFKVKAMDGAAWFNCPLKTPMGAKPYVCRFAEMYEGPTPYGLCAWRVTAQLEIFERQLLPDEWAQFPEFLRYASIIDIALNNRWPKANQ